MYISADTVFYCYLATLQKTLFQTFKSKSKWALCESIVQIKLRNYVGMHLKWELNEAGERRKIV